MFFIVSRIKARFRFHVFYFLILLKRKYICDYKVVMVSKSISNLPSFTKMGNEHFAIALATSRH